LKNKIEFEQIEFYSKYSNGQQAIKKIKKIEYPKISIISPVYNREKFLLRFIKSIQHQNFFDIEIIFVDDNSSDNSAKVIKKYMKKDKRILLIKNEKNRGTFKARNLGVLYSKGKYVIIPDPDDIISYNLINTCYYYAERYQYDFIRFNTYLGNGKLNFNSFSKNHEDRPIYQPELSTYIYYGNKELGIIDYFITNKFIKKQTYIKALNSLNNFYLNMYMTFLEDSIMNYLIYRVAKSFYYINIIG
jgi:glycosyltransferase involved in cell wall biosynthesis